MEKKYVLAVDQSTQGTKAILFDVNGDLVCRTDLPHRQLINEKGWVSHDLSEIYSNTIQVVKNLVEKAGIQKEEIACLGISNQRETSAAWSRSAGEPLAPAIVWQCSRASEICERIKTNVTIRTVSRRKTAVWQRSSVRRQECTFPHISRQRSLHGFRKMWRK